MERWRAEEEKVLIELCGRIGKGSGAAIREAGGSRFAACRTQVDLKDKWRNLEKSGRV